MTIGFALTGSFCTFHSVFPLLETLSQKYQTIPIVSQAVAHTDSRFGTAQAFLSTIEALCGQPPLDSVSQVEPIGPKKLLDALVIAPCTGNTLAKLAHSIADGPVTMAAKSHLRNGRPIILAVSSNDALAGGGENIGRLLNRKHFYFVPFRQDAPFTKPTSLVADFSLLPQTLEQALRGQQIQPLLLGPNI